MSHKKYLLSIVFTIFYSISHLNVAAQNFGGNPAYIKWLQINTDTVRVIFPKGLETQANRAASVIHYQQQNDINSLGSQRRKINVVLQNYGTISNGYVGLAPYRSEYFTTSPQNPFELGSTNWLDNLAVHEWRHVQQYTNFNKGLSKVAAFVLGEQGQALANSVAVPDWFYEGDAVLNETKLSSGGRGRLPLFFSGFKSITQNNIHYSYMQLRNGSFKNFIPNHYNLGYLLVAYGHEKYGSDLWRKVTSDAASFKPLFYPLQGAVKKHAGVSYNNFVKDAFNFYETQWKQETDSKYEFLTPLKIKDVVNYQCPYVTENGNIIVLKNSNKKIPAFYNIDKNGTERKIAVKNISIDDYYSYNNGKIVYASYKPDIRWNNKDFGEITIVDIATGNEQTIKHQAKYFSPDISHDGKKIAVVQIAPDDKYETQSKVVVMDNEGSKKATSYSEGYLFSYPKFSTSDSFVYAISRSLDGIENNIVKIGDNRIEKLFSSNNNTIGFLQIKGDTILFTVTTGNKDELWGYDEKKRASFRMASVSTGLYKGDILNDTTLIAATPTAYGYRIIKIKPQQSTYSLLSSNMGDALYINIGRSNYGHKNGTMFLYEIPKREFTTSKYRKGSHLFNFHSWRPYYENPEWSFTLYGENVLNTLLSELSYTYNENESSHRVKYTGTYGGNLIQPFISVSETFNRTGTYNNQTVRWNTLNFSPGLQLPLNFSGGKQYRFLRLFSAYNLEYTQWTGAAKNIFSNASFNYLNSGVSYSWQVQKAVQQIFPRFAQTLSVQYKNMIDKNIAQQFFASSNLYLPGLFNNHSLVINATYQSRDTANQFSFSNNFPFSRGYAGVNYPRMWKLAGNYHLPLLYPDWGIANIVYFLRVRGNVFYDNTTVKSLRTKDTFQFRTVGAEIMFDTKWWNSYPVSVGVRYNHLLDDGLNNKANANVWEVIFPVLF
ncbi:MAG: hypothetical protein V4556_06775 [Bacteroidota bacterium]